MAMVAISDSLAETEAALLEDDETAGLDEEEEDTAAGALLAGATLELELDEDATEALEEELPATQMPEQSAPPFIGSQLSLGSSTQVMPASHAMPAMPPHILAADAEEACCRTTTSVTRKTLSVPDTLVEPRTSTRLPMYEPNWRFKSVLTSSNERPLSKSRVWVASVAVEPSRAETTPVYVTLLVSGSDSLLELSIMADELDVPSPLGVWGVQPAATRRTAAVRSRVRLDMVVSWKEDVG